MTSFLKLNPNDSKFEEVESANPKLFEALGPSISVRLRLFYGRI